MDSTFACLPLDASSKRCSMVFILVRLASFFSTISYISFLPLRVLKTLCHCYFVPDPCSSLLFASLCIFFARCCVMDKRNGSGVRHAAQSTLLDRSFVDESRISLVSDHFRSERFLRDGRNGRYDHRRYLLLNKKKRKNEKKTAYKNY